MTRPTILRGLTLVVAVALTAAGRAQGQGATTGGIRGQITAGPDQPLAGAEVVAVSEETGLRR
ncbi:MAG TPA: hypothetical protein VNI61_01440, partial [Gemmatimonadales bacterium]|nr:hypothetical protein [Gemmatimonadales bacterium]